MLLSLSFGLVFVFGCFGFGSVILVSFGLVIDFHNLLRLLFIVSVDFPFKAPWKKNVLFINKDKIFK